MNWFRIRFAILLPLFSASISGCGSAPPTLTIHDLSWNPKSASVGVLTTFSNSFTYEDSDGDVAAVGLEWTDPTGRTVAPSPLPISKSEPSGIVNGSLQLAPPIAGRYVFDIWLIDAAARTSNKLSGTVDVQ